MASDGPAWRRLGSDPPSLGATARQAPPTLSLWRAGPAFVAVRARLLFANYGGQAECPEKFEGFHRFY